MCFLADLAFDPTDLFQRSLRPKSLHLTPVAVFLRARMMSLASIPTAVSSRRHHGLCSTVSWRIKQILWRPEGDFEKVCTHTQSHWQIWCKTFGSSKWIVWHHIVMMSAQKGKDSSVGESHPTLRWPFLNESGSWWNIKILLCLVSLFFIGPGTFWHSKARCKLRGSRTHTVGVWKDCLNLGHYDGCVGFKTFNRRLLLSALDWWEWPVVCRFLQQFAWGMVGCGWCFSDRITEKVLQIFSKSLQVFCESGHTNVIVGFLLPTALLTRKKALHI